MDFKDFNPVETAQELIGNLTDAIKATDASVVTDDPKAVFKAALLLQAGLRGLLSVKDRQDVALPRIFPNDPQELREAQGNFIDLKNSGAEPTVQHKEAGFKALREAVKQLDAQGYKKYADMLHAFVVQQGYGPAFPGGLAGSTHGVPLNKKYER